MKGSGFTFRDITIPRSSVTKEGVTCPLCNTLTKRFICHMKNHHKSSLTNADKVFESQFKNFLNAVRQARHKQQYDPIDIRDQQREMKRNSRKRLKKENPDKAKATRRRENERRRKDSFDSDEGLPCAICLELKPKYSFPPAGKCLDFERKFIKRQATLAFEAAYSRSVRTESERILELEAMEKGTQMVVNNKEKAVTETEAEYGGAWEDESEMEDDVDWKQVRPKWLVGTTAEWTKKYGRVKRIIRWNVEHGTRDEHERLRWKLKKLDKYADWLWLDLQKLCKDQELTSEETCEDEEKEVKDWALQAFEDLYTLEFEKILCRFCFFCNTKKPKID